MDLKKTFNKQGQLVYEESETFWKKYEYDKNGNMILSTDSDGNVYKREYNEQNQLTFEMFPNGYWKKWEYDTQGNLTYVCDYHGRFVRKEYDEQGNLIYSEDSDGVKKYYKPKKEL